MRIALENGHVRLKNCRYGPMLYLPADQYIGLALDKYGEFSEGEAFFFRFLVKPNWTVLDIGANHGAHTVALAKVAKAVHAFEPQRILFQLLCANVALNALTNVYTYQTAIGRTPGTINVPALDYTKSANFGALSLGGTGGEQVPLVSIDSLVLPECHFIKLDVEGMEGEAIAGAEKTLRQHQPILYVENDRPEKSVALIAQLFALDYRLYWHLPPYFNPNNHFGVAENIYGRTISVNMLGVPKSQPQQIKLREVLSPTDTWMAHTDRPLP
jgi:FkbM family methyltransferase